MSDYASRRMTMVDTQVRPSDVTKFPIIEAMLQVPREVYVPLESREAAYIGANIAIGQNRVILDPRALAKMLDALDIVPDELVLDLGCGLGYSAAVIAQIAGTVVAVEENAAWAEEAQSLLSQQGVDNAVAVAGTLSAGAPKHGPYDVIVIEGGIEALPEALVTQLKDGGRVGAIFMDGALGTVRIGRKVDGKLDWRDAFHATAPWLAGFGRARGFVL